jgi:hypothetical protein
MNNSRHILKLSCGLSCELFLNETTGAFNCEWSTHLPTKELQPLIEKEYIPWRNAIVEAWAQRTGKKILLVSL